MDQETARAWLRALPYDKAEFHYYTGAITEQDWTWYQHIWRNSAFRWSRLGESQQHRTREEHESCPICTSEGLKFDPVAAMKD